jgi:preprotein translocase SecE subunit
MEKENYNAKCLKCGYIFEADENESEINCPLCDHKMPAKEAMDSFKEKFKVYFPEKKSKKRILLEVIVFALSLSVFVFLLHFVISLIIELTSG